MVPRILGEAEARESDLTRTRNHVPVLSSLMFSAGLTLVSLAPVSHGYEIRGINGYLVCEPKDYWR